MIYFDYSCNDKINGQYIMLKLNNNDTIIFNYINILYYSFFKIN